MDFSKERSDFFKVVILLGLSAIVVVSLMYVTIPLIPVWSHTFHAAQKQVVWAGSAFGFAYAIGNVCFGTLSDRVRRIHILYVGLFLLSISTALVGFSPSLGWLITLRTIQGIVASSFPAVALAYVGDVLAPRYRTIAISVISSGFLLAGVFGQIYAGAIEKLAGWNGVFEVLAICYLIISLLMLRLPAGASPNTQSRASIAQVYIQMFKLFRVGPLVAAMAVAITILLSFVAMYLGLGPHVLEKFGINGQGLNWIRIAGIPSMLLSIVAGNLIKRFGGKPILIFGLLLAGIGIMMEALTGSLITLVISSMVFVAGIASAIPGILVLIGQLSGNARGSALSLYAFFVFIGASLGPLLASYLMPYGFHVLGTTLGAILVLAAFISWQGIRMGKKMTEALRLET